MLTSVGRRYVHGTAAAITVISALSVAGAAGLVPIPAHGQATGTRVATADRPAPAAPASSSTTEAAARPATSRPAATAQLTAAGNHPGPTTPAAAAAPATTAPRPPAATAAPGPATTEAPVPAPTRTQEPQAAPAPSAPTPTPSAPSPSPTTPATTPAAPPATTPPTVAPGPAPRTQPSSAQVQQAIAGLGPYVQSIVTPSASQVGQIGDAICTAFDQGKSYSYVSQQVQSELNSLPLTTVRSGATGYVITTAVNLYCPGYASKLG